VKRVGNNSVTCRPQYEGHNANIAESRSLNREQDPPQAVIEAHVLTAIRHKHRVDMAAVRRTIDFLKTEFVSIRESRRAGNQSGELCDILA
jgi:hypothetical protein